MLCKRKFCNLGQNPNRMKRFKKSLKVILALFVIYLGLGYFLHLVIFPEFKPDVSNYFQPGDEFYSQEEGLRQTVIKQKNGRVYCRVEFDPGAEGPPMHIHTKFDEVFIGGDHVVNMNVDGEEKELHPGEELKILKGTPHKPYNNSDQKVILEMEKEENTFPEKFAVYLNQVYRYMDESPANMKPPKVIFQMAMFNQHFDSYLGEGPPVGVQKAFNFLIVPLARLMGYKSYYKEHGMSNHRN